MLDLEIRVYQLCTDITAEPTSLYRPFNSKLMLRARAIQALAQKFKELGVLPSQIFAAGHSMGAMASMIAVQGSPSSFAGMVGFAPGCCDPKANRAPRLAEYRAWVHERIVSEGQNFDALVFAFHGDRFESPEDLEDFRRVPKLELVALASEMIDGIRCTGPTRKGWRYDYDPHLTLLCQDPSSQDRKLSCAPRAYGEVERARKGVIYLASAAAGGRHLSSAGSAC